MPFHTEGYFITEVAPHSLRQAVLAWADKCNRERKTVHWRFAQKDARNTLQRHYQKVQKFI
jgi:hypothetical protein